MNQEDQTVGRGSVVDKNWSKVVYSGRHRRVIYGPRPIDIVKAIAFIVFCVFALLWCLHLVWG